MIVTETLKIDSKGSSMEFKREHVYEGENKPDCKLPATSFKDIFDAAKEYFETQNMD